MALRKSVLVTVQDTRINPCSGLAPLPTVAWEVDIGDALVHRQQ
jgi:hypothetical protein